MALKDRDMVLHDLRDQLQQAQAHIKSVYDASHHDVQFNVGHLVLLKLQPYRQILLQLRCNRKLSPMFYDPYRIVARIGQVAYKLDLPADSKIHYFFHVSHLKKYHGSNTDEVSPSLPLVH